MKSAKAGMPEGGSELEVCCFNVFGWCGAYQPFGLILPSPARSLDAPVRAGGHGRVTGRVPCAQFRQRS